jgi:hypothetical protein
MTRQFRTAARLGGWVVISLTVALSASDEAQPQVELLKKNIVSRTPQTRATKVDHERLTARRIDIVDENGVIRMTLAAPTPEPIIDGIQYKRAFPVSGFVVYDRNGSERGGFGVADIEGSAVVLAQDHANVDAIGWRVMPDGSVSFMINQRPPVTREPELGNAIVPALNAPARVEMRVSADGAPSIALSDKESRPRLRLTVTEAGHGAIEFLDAAGKVVETFAPELRRAGTRPRQ